jgi:YD repeat-containing protein
VEGITTVSVKRNPRTVSETVFVILILLAVICFCFSFVPASAGLYGRSSDSEDTGEPISASNGEYYFTKTPLSLGGLQPLDFTVEYSPLNLPWGWYRGEYPFPLVFTTNTWIPIDKINVRSGDTVIEYVFIQFLHDRLSFRKNAGVWESQDKTKYHLTETDGYFYMLDPTTELIYIFGKRYYMVLHVMDRNGNSLTYSYNSDLQPTRIDDGLGRALIMSYNAPTGYGTNYLSEVKDSFARTVTFAYEDEEDPSGEWPRIILKSMTDPMDNIVVFDYQNFDDDQSFGSWGSVHPSSRYMTKQILPEGNVPYEQTWARENLYGIEQYRVVSQKDAYGNEFALSYNESANIVTVTQPDGTQRIFVHEFLGGWFRERTDETGKSFSMDYNDAHCPTTLIDRYGDTTTITYHPESGKIASITNNKGDTINFTYAAQNQTFVNPQNGESFNIIFYNFVRIDYPNTAETFTYDANGNMLTYTDRAGKTWMYTYNTRGQVTQLTNPTGAVIDYTYNADATLNSSTDSDLGTTTYGYDAYKRLNRISHPDATVIQIAYDLNDRVTGITDERGNVYTYTYDANGNLVIATDPAGNETRYAYDLMDRVVERTNRRDKTETYTYDIMNRLASITDANGNSYQLAYDPRGWLNQITDPAGKVWLLTYDDEGLVNTMTTPLNHTTTYTRDKLGYLTSITDPLGHTITFTRDNMSRITAITDPLGRTTTYTYDQRGILASVTRPDIGTANFAYTDLGLLATISDLNGKEWNFTYTPMGRLQNLTDPLGNTWLYAYNEHGFLEQDTYPTGETQNRTYDAAGNLVSQEYSDGTDLQYSYDALNRLVTPMASISPTTRSVR